MTELDNIFDFINGIVLGRIQLTTQITEEEKNEYIASWVNTTVTLEEWLKNRIIDHWEEIGYWDLKNAEIEQIEQHQFNLFNQCVRNVVKFKIERLNQLDFKTKTDVIKEHLRVIELFTNSTQPSPFIIALLKPIIWIKDSDYLPTLINYQQNILRTYDEFKSDFNFNNSPPFNAAILFNYKDALNKIIKENNPLQPKIKPEQKNKLSDLITHINKVEIVENLKIHYWNIKGKRLKLLLMAFQHLDLLPKERIAQKFYNCCKNEFDWNIASYNAMNGYNYNEKTDKDELNSMKKYLETLTKQK